VIVAGSAHLLRAKGCFMAYQVRTDIQRTLERHFARLDRATEWWNLPPMRLWWARRG
jgi:hypothetical protein